MKYLKKKLFKVKVSKNRDAYSCYHSVIVVFIVVVVVVAIMLGGE